MFFSIVIFCATLFLAYSNGANDNFKGVATLFGSGTTNYKISLTWATVTTFAGSICSIYFAEKLLKNFSGKGLVPTQIAVTPEFLLAVALGAGLTVMLAAVMGFPISTTHSLIGALLGSGLVAVGSQLNFSALGNAFVIPLLVSPLIAVVLSGGFYFVFRYLRLSSGIEKEMCVCIEGNEKIIPLPQSTSVLSFEKTLISEISVESKAVCEQKYLGSLFGFDTQKILDFGHFLSAGVVSFARGLNDTPKIVALLLLIEGLKIELGMLSIGLGMAIGGILNARKVAQTMSNEITEMNHGQGFTANLTTGLLVIFASKIGVPVSTTHVSVCSIFGIGLVTRKANKRVVSNILMSWVLTLPIAAILSGIIYFLV